ncbi:formate--tetrahydrofolate ligase [Gorillibacterium massiliense]|uniref:formate--tetrahydrofolate ligase n=1 Tax=Gorillibacterium massiliense TaxID=1280390 RepID=UPI0004ACF3D1|nr:formate--tetrahydrofolate ligase [Gorillibacterium massiliense]
MKPIKEIAAMLDIAEDELEYYGKFKAKIAPEVMERVKEQPDGKLVLVTSMNPTPAGEGKTLTTIGLSQALNRIGVRTIAALREPSLGPCMGIKGGATGSGQAQVMPMEDINLHFTGDLHAVTAAHNLLAAMIDNHLYHGNALSINPSTIIWKRAMDMNDRSLRQIVTGLGAGNGNPREAGFLITVASEVMAILCLSENLADLQERISRIIIGYRYDGQPVTAGDLQADGAMALLLKDAIKPNLVQTIEGTPAFVHGGPFANIAHGCSSVAGTKLALKLADCVVTEAGFGADLGAEKFFDIKCRKAGLKPDAAVIVATVKALKYNGGAALSELSAENLSALKNGFANLAKHIENVQKFGVPVVVAINRFFTDTEAELACVKELCTAAGVQVELSEVWEKGGAGGEALARTLIGLLESGASHYQPIYATTLPIKEKIEIIVREIYGGADVTYSPAAEKAIRKAEDLGFGDFPVCMAKTQYSLSDSPKRLGRPEGFTIHIREVNLSAGAGFLVAFAGEIMIMPGLPKVPAAVRLGVDASGNAIGLF